MSISTITPPVYPVPLDNSVTTLASNYTTGGATLTVTNGSVFGSPSSSAPIRVTCQRVSDGARVHFKVTNVTGNVLTLAGLMDGYSDISLLIGDTIGVLVSAGTILDVQTTTLNTITSVNTVINQVNNNTTSIPTVAHSTSILKGDGSGNVIAASPGTDYLATAPTITLTGPVTGSGTGSFTTTITVGSVTSAMLAGSIPASKLVVTDIFIANTQVSGLGTASTLAAGSANGVATLDSGGKVPVSQIPSGISNGNVSIPYYTYYGGL